MWPLIGLAIFLAGCYSSYQRQGVGPTDANAEDDAVEDSISEPEEPGECERTCEPSACSDTLRVPADYTLEAAVSRAQLGDIIQIDPGTYELEEPLYLNECTHIRGAGRVSTEITSFSALDPLIYGSNGSSINGISLTTDYSAWLLLVNDASMTVSNCGPLSFRVTGNSNLILEDTQYTAGIFEDNSVGSITDNVDFSLVFRDNSFGYIENNDFRNLIFLHDSSAYVRNNTFSPIAPDESLRFFESIYISYSADPDLGTESDPGNNLFINNSSCYSDESCSLRYAYSITNRTPNAIKALGNFFEDSYMVNTDCSYHAIDYCPPLEMEGTCQEMDHLSNITAIYDGHDTECDTPIGALCGIVEYSNYGCI